MKRDFPSVRKRNNVTISGRGQRPIMLANGLGCDQSMWRFFAPAFEDDYRIIRFDYIGSGTPDNTGYDPERYSTLNGYAQDIVEICDELDLHDVIFVGHSVSSTIGLLAAKQAPERFSHLILIGPSPRYINELPDYFGGFEKEDLIGLIDLMDKNDLSWADMLAPLAMKNEDQPQLTDLLKEKFCTADQEIIRQFAEVTFFSDNRQDLPKVKVPTLIIQCSDDSIAPQAVGEFVHQQIPSSTYKVMNATGHCPHLSHPQETIELVKQYLADTEEASAKVV